MLKCYFSPESRDLGAGPGKAWTAAEDKIFRTCLLFHQFLILIMNLFRSKERKMQCFCILSGKMENKNRLVAQSVNYLQSKHENITFISKTHLKSQVWWCVIVVPVLRRQRQPDSWGLAGQPSLPNQQVSGQMRKLKTQSGQILRESPNNDLESLHILMVCHYPQDTQKWRLSAKRQIQNEHFPLG